MVEDKPNDSQVKMTGFAIKGSKAPKRKFVPGGDEGGGLAAEKDLIVAIGDKGIQSLKPKEKEKPKEIAPLSNSWQLHGKRQADAKAKYAKIADEISAINYGKPGTTADAAETTRARRRVAQLHRNQTRMHLGGIEVRRNSKRDASRFDGDTARRHREFKSTHDTRASKRSRFNRRCTWPRSAVEGAGISLSHSPKSNSGQCW